MISSGDRVKHKIDSSHGIILRTDGRLALVKWDNVRVPLLALVKDLEPAPQ